MPELNTRSVHVDRLLTEISIGYKNAVYIVDDLSPELPVGKQSNIVPKYDQSHWFRNMARLRAPGTKSQRGGFSVDNTDTYYCHKYSFGFEVPWDVEDNADEPYELERDGTEFVSDKLDMCRELEFAANSFTAGKWGTDKVGATDFAQWSDYGSSSPLVDIESWKDALEGKIAREPNVATFGKQAWTVLKWHPDLIDTIKYTQRAQMTLEIFGGLIEIPKVLVGRGIYTLSPEGTPEANVVYTRIWGKHGLFLYVPPRPSLMTPAACYTFVWRRVPNAKKYIRRFEETPEERYVLEGNSYFQHKITAPAAGLFAQNVAA